jgi:outer membrane immunogenic protein
MKAWAFALIFSLSLLGAERALAADVPLPGPAPIPPPSYYPPASYYPASAPVNWGGVYIGLNGGYGLGKSNWSNTLGSTGNFAANGGLFGATLGINYAGFGDWVLLGFEGDFDWSGAQGSAGCSGLDAALGGELITLPAGSTCQTRIDWLSTFRLRAGYTWSHFLFYATAGGAVGDFRLSSQPSNFGHNPTSPLGWAAGAGVEYLFNDAISVKLEYLYVDLGTVSCPTVSNISTLPGILCSADQQASSGKVSFTENLIRAGINYKFSW